jgi:membrane protease YdiL (CAAX protease family)
VGSLLPLFLDSKYQLRSGWKFLGYCVLLVGLFVVLGLGVGLVVALANPELFELPHTDMRLMGLNAIVLFFPAAIALVIMALVDRLPFRVFGVAIHDYWLKDFGVGIAIAAGMLGLTLAGSFLFGEVRMEWTGSIDIMPSIFFALAVLLLAALNEELVFRGYPLQILLKSLRPWGAMLFLSAVFGLLHSNNPGASVMSVMNTILAGVMLALAYLKTRSLWLPYGIHLGWNAGLSVALGYPVSGLQTPSLVTTQVSGSEWILGGGYGPEAGIIGTFIFAAAAVAIQWTRIVKVSPQIQAALKAHENKVYAENV